MKSIFIIIIFLLTSTICSAETYVYTNKTTDEVIFITDKPNVVIDEKEKNDIVETILPKDLEFYALTEAYSDYKLSSKKFVLNTKKISDRENAKLEAIEQVNKKNADFASAKAKLIQLGLTSDEVDALK